MSNSTWRPGAKIKILFRGLAEFRISAAEATLINKIAAFILAECHGIDW